MNGPSTWKTCLGQKEDVNNFTRRECKKKWKLIVSSKDQRYDKKGSKDSKRQDSFFNQLNKNQKSTKLKKIMLKKNPK